MSTILIVDDDSAVAEVVAMVLNNQGFDTKTAGSFSQATGILETNTISGAIIDVWLGADDGLELATMLGVQNPPFPFIVMSGGGPGRSLETVTARADSLGAAAVLYKPFDDDELLEAVERMLGLNK